MSKQIDPRGQRFAAALTALVETDWCKCPGHLFFTGFLLLVVTAINLRLGPLFALALAAAPAPATAS